MFVLLDCNNFFVSCERVFNPRLDKKPVLVLSNNDGCVIARSQETKDLGIPMGAPYFQVKDLCDRHNITIFSSNFSLYGDMSSRVMSILETMAPDIEVYSIDEAFLHFPDTEDANLYAYCIEIRQKIAQWLGLPVSLGIAPTKTLAKLANSKAKKDKTGVFDLRNEKVREDVLAQCPVRDLWGIGYNSDAKLRGLGIASAKAFRDMDLSFVRKQMGVVGERMVLELRGISCLELEEECSKQSITSSRSFGKPLNLFSDIAEALSTYVNTACVKLRQQESCAQALYVYLEASFDKETRQRERFSSVVSLPQPTNDTPQLITLAKTCLRRIFQEKRFYKKCGVVLLDLIDEKAIAPDFFQEKSDPKRRKLAETVDAINADRGKNTLFYGAMGVNPHWKMRCEKRSPAFTSSWDEILVVNAER